jgi:hypothetical protein
MWPDNDAHCDFQNDDWNPPDNAVLRQERRNDSNGENDEYRMVRDRQPAFPRREVKIRIPGPAADRQTSARLH